jgi:hypothetical protein
MSAFIISDLHTFTIAEFIAERTAQDFQYINPQKYAQNLANKLKRVNIESVNYRYSEKTPRTKCNPRPVTIKDPATVYKLCKCWIYQSCEDQHNPDFHALSALIETAFSPAEKQAPAPALWCI